MNIIIFEDNFYKDLFPFTYNHASFEVKTGMHTNIERFIKSFSSYNLIVIVRDEIKELTKERFKDIIVNPSVIPKGYCINSRVVWKDEYNASYFNGNNYSNKESLLIYNNKEDVSLIDFFKILEIKNIETIDNSSILLINYLWNAIDLFEEMLNNDFLNSEIANSKEKFQSVFYINQNNIKIGNDVIIKAGTILDAEKGPIIIGDNVTIDIGSKIQGPVFIDNNSYISPGAKIRGHCLIGKKCKIGGEVIHSIFHAKSNKVHDGFIGHSYIGEWVNIGAGTNNSNLKNNYSTVKFNFNQKEIDSNRLFLGSMIGDYTRIGISSMLNTGTFIGFGANIFGADFLDKHTKSFSWGRNDIVKLDKFLDTCEKMKKRRDETLSDIEKKLMVRLYNDKKI